MVLGCPRSGLDWPVFLLLALWVGSAHSFFGNKPPRKFDFAGNAAPLAIDQRPEDTVVLVGLNSSATLRCLPSPGTIIFASWSYFNEAVDDDGWTVIYRYLPTEPPGQIDSEKYEIADESNNDFSLTIKNVDLSDGTDYRCLIIVDSVPNQATASVVTLGAPTPSFPPNIAVGRDANLSCSANFGSMDIDRLDAAMLPKLQLFVDEVEWTNDNSYTDGGAPTRIPSLVENSFLFNVDESHNGAVFSCKIFTEKDSSVQLTTQVILKAQYPTDEVLIYPMEQTFRVGDVINCTANGHPEPEMQWNREPPMGDPVIGPQLELTEEMGIGAAKWNCSARNQMDGGTVGWSSSAIEFELIPLEGAGLTGEKQFEDWEIALMVIFPILFIIILVLIICYCCCRKENSSTKSTRKKSQQQQQQQQQHHHHHQQQQQQQPRVTTRTSAATEIDEMDDSQLHEAYGTSNNGPRGYPGARSPVYTDNPVISVEDLRNPDIAGAAHVSNPDLSGQTRSRPNSGFHEYSFADSPSRNAPGGVSVLPQNPSSGPTGMPPKYGYNYPPERDRSSMDRPSMDRPSMDRPSMDRPSMEGSYANAQPSSGVDYRPMPNQNQLNQPPSAAREGLNRSMDSQESYGSNRRAVPDREYRPPAMTSNRRPVERENRPPAMTSNRRPVEREYRPPAMGSQDRLNRSYTPMGSRNGVDRLGSHEYLERSQERPNHRHPDTTGWHPENGNGYRGNPNLPQYTPNPDPSRYYANIPDRAKSGSETQI